MELSKLQKMWLEQLPRGKDGKEADLCYDGEDLGFSWHDCECCGSPLGGDRYKAAILDEALQSIELSVCADCINYIANGDVPEDLNIDWLLE